MRRRLVTVGRLVARWPACAPHLLSVLRVGVAFTFVLAGTIKLFAVPVGIPPRGGTVPLVSELGLAGVLETFGGGLLVLGLFTRPLALLLAVEMAVAYVQVALPQGIWPVTNQGMPSLFACLIWLYVSAAGAGPWSLDARWRDTGRVLSAAPLDRGRVEARPAAVDGPVRDG